MPTVTAGEIRRRVQSLAGDTSRTFIEDADVYDWIMDAQHQISKIAECLTSNSLVNITAGTAFYSLSNPILRPISVLYNLTKLRKTNYDDIVNIDPTFASSGTPTHYYIDGGQVGLWPVPDSSLVNGLLIRARILSTAVIDSDGDIIEIPDFFREDIVRYCMLKMREKDEQPETMALLLQDWQHKISVSRDIVNSPEADTYPVVRDAETMYDYAVDWYGS